MGRSEPEQLFCYPSDSESCGTRPRIIMRTPWMASVPRISCDRQDLHELKLPLAGFIFMCDGRTKYAVCKQKFLCTMGSTSRKMYQKIMLRVKPGTKLFIFDYGARLLSGVYEVTTFPHSSHLSSEHESLSYKVYFQIYERHQPLEERVFRHAIEENYFSPGKFHMVLGGDQVKALLALYRSQRHLQSLNSYKHPFSRESCWPPHANYNDRSKFPSTHNSMAMTLSCMPRRGADGKHSKIYQHCCQRFNAHSRGNAHITGANAVPLNPRKKKMPSEELLGLDVKHTVGTGVLDKRGAVHDDQKLSEEGEKMYSGRVLENWKFNVAPNYMTTESSSIDNMEVHWRIQEAHITGTNAVPDLKPRKKKLPSEEVLGQIDVEHKLATGILDKSSALEEAAEKALYCGSVLEDGEFVAPTTTLDQSSSINKDPGSIQESPDASVSTARVETQNLIEKLEDSVTSVSNSNSAGVFTSSRQAAMLYSSDDHTESPAKERAIQISAGAEYRQNVELVHKNAQAIVTARGSGKRTRDLFASGLFSDREKVKQSVWLRLSDPRPKMSGDWLHSSD
ncbi:hypothetical protein GOP47_0013810 [Adiantum capillus-veneris]|uniref:DCD domain-containing protein n=1 Tax=Adiantum capillus-veneris TaxID=13818 RepID=A0A9D4ZDR2_ADICA|nr:hypothetical protein GOP47_0013810 [Adiantum capillus-veneris]